MKANKKIIVKQQLERSCIKLNAKLLRIVRRMKHVYEEDDADIVWLESTARDFLSIAARISNELEDKKDGI